MIRDRQQGRALLLALTAVMMFYDPALALPRHVPAAAAGVVAARDLLGPTAASPLLPRDPEDGWPGRQGSLVPPETTPPPATEPGALRLAHAILIKSLPGEDAALSGTPEEIEVWFNEGVGEEYSALAVVDGSGTRVDNRDGRLGYFDKSYLRVSVPPLAPGVYTVRYRVQSADGHIVSGKFGFSIVQP